MNCINCGKALPDDSLFCPFCGTSLMKVQQSQDMKEDTVKVRYTINTNGEGNSVAFNQTDAESAIVSEDDFTGNYNKNQQSEAEALSPSSTQSPSRKHKRLNKKLFFGIGGAVLVVILAAIIIPVSIHNAKQARYNEGTMLLESGDYKAAEEVFLSLDGFDDSDEMVDYAQKGMNYEKAVQAMKQNKYSEAKAVFDTLGDFKDSVLLSAKCQQAIDYETAMELYNAGNYAEAETLFYSIGEYKDAKQLAAECGAQVSYARAKEHIEAGEYDAARELLLSLDAAVFTDRDELISECDNMPKYLEAQALLDSGKNYEAYVLFTELGEYKDSVSISSKCKVSKPSTGETYRNNDYKGSACSLTIKPPTSDGSSTYIKVYSSDGTLVSCVFINAGGKAKIKLPAGDFKLKAAYGFDTWFGETDMFGDSGVYQVLKFNSTSEVFTFKKNYDYTLTLRSAANNTGNNVATEKENRKDF